MKSTESDPRFYVAQSTIPGARRGLFAKESLEAGARLHVIGVLIPALSISDQCTAYADEYKVRVGDHLLIPTGWGAIVNHSDSPNVEKIIEDGAVFMQALRPIAANEEILCTYSEYAQRRFGPMLEPRHGS